MMIMMEWNAMQRAMKEKKNNDGQRIKIDEERDKKKLSSTNKN